MSAPSIPDRAHPTATRWILAGLVGAGLTATLAAAGQPLEPTGLSIAHARLVPGASSYVDFRGPGEAGVRSGRVELRFSPEIFLDTPGIAFAHAPEDLSFALTHLGPGRYAVKFEVPDHAPALRPETLFSLSAVLGPALRPGGNVHVTAGGTLLLEDGREVEIDLRRHALLLRTDSYPITLHVEDRSDLRPGERVTVALYTYNPKLISDGQICLRFDSSFFTSVESVAVQGEPDVSYVAGPERPGVLLVRFSSPSSSINRYEGSIVRIGMRVAEGLPDGLETMVEVDMGESFLRDHAGELVNLESDSGRFRVGSDY